MKKKSSMKKAVESVKMDDTPMTEKVMGNGCVCGSSASDCAGWGLFILRLAIGGSFIWHGVTKFMNFAGTQAFFTTLFGGAGPVLAGLVAGVEVLAGIALVVGIWSRWASYLLAAVLLVAIFWAKHVAWPNVELDVVMAAGLLAIAWNGAGKWSLHSNCGCCGNNCNC